MDWIYVDKFQLRDVRALLQGNVDKEVLLDKATGMRPWAVARLIAIAACTGRSLADETASLLTSDAALTTNIDADIRGMSFARGSMRRLRRWR